VKLMRVFEITHLDHGGGNLSTFIGKAVASGKADLYESLTGAMAGLAGPLHGRANQECLEFIQECVAKVSANFTAADVTAMLQKKLDNKEVVYGFGHAVLRVEDPRARVLRSIGEDICPNDTNFRMVKLLAEVGPGVLKKNPKISDPHPNVDSVSGSLLMACGLVKSEYYTVLFGLSRVIGISAQIVYERCEARGGKGTPIIRPKYFYSPEGTAKGEAVIAGSG
jgi:citrate synthase